MEIMQQELLAEPETNASHGETILKTLVSNEPREHLALANTPMTWSRTSIRRLPGERSFIHRQKLEADNDVIPDRDHLLKPVRLCSQSERQRPTIQAISLAVENQNLIEPTTRFD